MDLSGPSIDVKLKERKKECHAGGNEIMTACWVTQEKFVDVLKKQALGGTTHKALSPVRSY
jgi:hypothetical protein